MSVKETLAVETQSPSCDGGGALGHPRVFLKLKNGEATCPYCGRRFVAAANKQGGEAH